MDTDDDIFIIHKRTEAYIHTLHKQQSQLMHKQKDLLQKLLLSKPPHGFTEDNWQDIANKYGMDLETLRQHKQSSERTRGSPKRIKSPRVYKLTYKECKDILKELEKIKQVVELMTHIYFYESQARDIIDRYKQCINHVVYTDFMAPVKNKDISPEQKALRDELICIIENVFGTEALEKIVTRKQCTGSARSFIVEDGVFGGEGHSVDAEVEADENDEDWNSMVYNDINRINFNIKFKYDKRLHFKETINQYQGLQHKHIPQEVYNDLLDMIDKHGLCDHTKIDSKEKFAKLRKEHITMFLSESDHSIYYEDKQLIYSKITGHPCPNIQKLEKGLFSDFEQLVEVFLQLPDDKVDRKNFLNTHYVLRQLLRKRGVIVPEHDLNIIKTPARIRAHDDIYQLCCEKLGWNFEPLG
jgi:hypothetical protein